MTKRPMYHSDDEEEGFAGDEQYEECEICHQEFRGVCPINSADCPYADLEEDEEDEIPDFEDVEDLDDLIEDDEEIEKIIEDGADIPVEDLIDEETGAEKETDEGPSKTIEELEAEAEEAARTKRKSGKKAGATKARAKSDTPKMKKK